jgi:hypothetical protein
MRSIFVFLAAFLRPQFGGGPKMPKVQPVAANPVDDSAAREARSNAATAAQAEALAGGRRATMVSGMEGQDEQEALGGAKSRKRASGYLSV